MPRGAESVRVDIFGFGQISRTFKVIPLAWIILSLIFSLTFARGVVKYRRRRKTAAVQSPQQHIKNRRRATLPLKLFYDSFRYSGIKPVFFSDMREAKNIGKQRQKQNKSLCKIGEKHPKTVARHITELLPEDF